MARTTAELVMATTLDLPREQQKKVLRLARALRAGSPAAERLERMLLDGLDSGPAHVAHSEYWARKKKEWAQSARKPEAVHPHGHGGHETQQKKDEPKKA